MRIALIHDWLETYAGAERVLEQLVALYPQADLFSLVDFLPAGKRGFIADKPVRTSFIQRLPLARRFFRMYLPFFPLAIRLLNLKDYDLIISDSHCVAKGVKTRPGQVHICYCHTPVRYAWDMLDEYLAETHNNGWLKGTAIRLVLRFLRWFDVWSNTGVTAFVANSRFIAQRIQTYYHRDAHVVHPPVAVADFTPVAEKQDFYMTASRLVPYKRVALIAEAFKTMPERRLVIIGAGPEAPKVKAIAETAPNIDYMGYQDFQVLKRHMADAKAFVFAAREDFGITPVEALACGTPVIAFGEGGALDSVTPDVGLFFKEQTPEAIIQAVTDFEAHPAFSATACRTQAERFAPDVFKASMASLVNIYTKQ